MTARAVRITALAERDIADIHRHSRREFGKAAAHRYRALIALGIDTLAEDPFQRTARNHAGLLGGAKTFHLRHVRQTEAVKVGHPRHLLVFAHDERTIEILRVLHEAMDLPRHVSTR